MGMIPQLVANWHIVTLFEGDWHVHHAVIKAVIYSIDSIPGFSAHMARFFLKRRYKSFIYVNFGL